VTIRAVTAADFDELWPLLRDVFRAGATYAVDPDIGKEDALAYWTSGAACFVSEDGQGITGTYYIKAKQAGVGGHRARQAV